MSKSPNWRWGAPQWQEKCRDDDFWKIALALSNTGLF